MFVSFEGPEGAGKSTLVSSLAKTFAVEREVVVTREPGGTAIGKAIRTLLLEGTDLSLEAELMLFLADRAEHVASVIQPALERGALVLCDRFADSTVVYQGYARNLDKEFLRACNAFVSRHITPSLTLLLDLPVDVGLDRIASKDRLDSLPLAFHQRVRDGFLSESKRDPSRWIVLDAQSPPEALSQRAEALIRTRLSA